MIEDVEVREAGAKGRGVYARRAFARGEFIFRRRHIRVVTAEELPTLSEWERIHLCELAFDRFAVLAAPGCYLNHSCDLNTASKSSPGDRSPSTKRSRSTTGSMRSTATPGRAPAAQGLAPGPWSEASSRWTRCDRRCSSRTRRRSYNASTGSEVDLGEAAPEHSPGHRSRVPSAGCVSDYTRSSRAAISR